MKLRSRQAPPDGAVTAAPGAAPTTSRRAKSLILIDTPGYGPNTGGNGGALASRQGIEVHLVLSASMKSADLSRVVDRFEIFRRGQLLCTRLDEAGGGGIGRTNDEHL